MSTKKKDNSGIHRASDPEEYERLLEQAEKKRPTRFITLEETGFVVEVVEREPVEILEFWELVGVSQTVLTDPDAPQAQKTLAGSKLLDGQLKILDHAIRNGWIKAPTFFPSDYEPKEGEKGVSVLRLSRRDRKSLVDAFTTIAEEDEAVKKADSFHDDQGGDTRGDTGPEKES